MAENSLPDRDPNWRSNLLGKPPTKYLADLTVVRYVQIKMTPAIASLTSAVAKDNGMTREGWLRHVIAEAIAQERPELTPAALLEGMPHGRIGERHRPETTRG
jgi:hypothetical protein